MDQDFDLNALAQQASQSASYDGDYSSPSSSQTKLSGSVPHNYRRHHLRALHKVISDSDIVVLVLDARDPLGCRSKLVEEEVLRRADTEGKHLVFVLNKVDLVPKENARAWLTYLRHTTPTLPFVCSNNLTSTNGGTRIQASPTAQALLKLLKAHRPSSRSVTVGVVGFPNVGKSSLINALARAKACGVGAQPGFTRDLQSVQVEKGIKIVDSPGVIFDEYEDGDAQRTGVLLRNVVKAEEIVDPIGLVGEILKRSRPESLAKVYHLETVDPLNPSEFLTMVSLTTGRLGKGGAPDLVRTARQIILDWNHQKIPYFTEPPKIHPSNIPSTISKTGEVAPGAEDVGQARITTSLGQAFSLNGLFDDADRGAFKGEDDPDAFIPDDDEDMQPVSTGKRPRSPSVSLSENTAPQPTRVAKRRRVKKERPTWDEPVDADRLAQQNPLSRRNMKREAKRIRRREARGMGGMRELMAEGGIGLEDTFMAVAIE